MPRAAPGFAPERVLSASADRSFPRSARLTRPREFRRVFDGAVKSNDRAFTLLARRSLAPGARLGLAISKKCARRAIDRQRIKRLVRESFRHVRGELPAIDIVVMCRPVAVDMSNRELTQALDTHWRRLKRQCEES